MKEIIPFKKEILFKTHVKEITDISLTHDYKVLDGEVSGEFIVEGSYKMTEASVQTEEFFYKIPFSIALGNRINEDSVNLEMGEFNYNVVNDVLSLSMSLNLLYEDTNVVENSIDDLLDKNEEINREEVNQTVNILENNIDTSSTINNITSNMNLNPGYATYKIYMAKEDDTMDSISINNNINIKELSEINNTSTVNFGDKIVIPYIEHE
ncbi:MAG: hypothetical protein RSB41_02995 [Bacilli bacterium]